MENLTEQQRQALADRLNGKRVGNLCPMCHQGGTMKLADGYFQHALQRDFSGAIVLGGPSIPTVVLVCGNCGFVSEHAAGILGLLEKRAEEVAG